MDYRQVTVHPEAHIAPNATLVGKVDVAAGATVLFNATLRGDYGSRIAVGEGSNIQENACVHLDFDQDCLIGRGVTIGHGAVVHGCTLGDNVLVGMGAIVMNGARVGDNSLVAAGASCPRAWRCRKGRSWWACPARYAGRSPRRDRGQPEGGGRLRGHRPRPGRPGHHLRGPEHSRQPHDHRFKALNHPVSP